MCSRLLLLRRPCSSQLEHTKGELYQQNSHRASMLRLNSGQHHSDYHLKARHRYKGDPLIHPQQARSCQLITQTQPQQILPGLLFRKGSTTQAQTFQSDSAKEVSTPTIQIELNVTRFSFQVLMGSVSLPQHQGCLRSDYRAAERVKNGRETPAPFLKGSHNK